MHQTTFVPSIPVFYPIGNTPAVNLLSNYTADDANDEPVDILLLACGDPRSILYSLWSEDKPTSGKFSFTCCDLEPAILARNVMLFSLMIDRTEAYSSPNSKFTDPNFGALWNLFFHLYIPQNNLSILQTQAQTLLYCSETVEEWAKSPYGVIKFVSKQTLEELRGIWTKYTEKKEGRALAVYEKSVRDDVVKTHSPYSTGGTTLQFSGGPFWRKGLKIANEAMKGFWTTGVVAGNGPDVKELGNNRQGWVNPMAMVSAASQKFAWHNSLDPLVDFHMTSAFQGDVSDRARVKKAMVTLAKEQFFEWSKAFVAYAEHGSISINIFYGDAMNFCHELGAGSPSTEGKVSITRLYSAPWAATPLALDGMQNVPKSFDIIDCSNMADWAGYINVMAATAPLLSRKASSILYIESLRLTASKPEQFLDHELFMVPDLASLIFGLAPMGHVLGYTTENSSAEDMTFADCGRRHRKRIWWKVPTFGDWNAHEARPQLKGCDSNGEGVGEGEDLSKSDPDLQANRVRFEAKELCEIFFRLYSRMFAHENPIGSQEFGQPFSSYNRMTIAAVLQLAKRNVDTDWKSFFLMLDKKISEDESLETGEIFKLQLRLVLKVSGVWDECPLDEVTLPGPLKALGARTWVFVTLVVPRKKLRILEKTGRSPGLIMAIENEVPHGANYGDNKNLAEDIFECLDCCFGSIEPRKEEELYLDVFEEEGAWEGSGDLIVTCPVPSSCLVGVGSTKPKICLNITSAVASMHYLSKLENGEIYRASLDDKNHVFVTTHPPGINSGLVESGTSPRAPVPSFDFAAMSILDPKKKSHVEIKASYPSPRSTEVTLQAVWYLAAGTPEAEALSAGVLQSIITLPESSPCTMLIKIGKDHSQRLIFPYPVNTAKAKTRVARKSLWIEVSVPTSSALSPGGYVLNPFPLAMSPGKQVSAWSIQKFNLPKQPAIKPDGGEDWVLEFVLQMCSKREDRLVSDETYGNGGFMNHLANFKSIFKDILMSMNDLGGNFGFSGQPVKNFLFTTGTNPYSQDNVADTVIVGSCMRHGRETGTIILDGWVVPWSCIDSKKLKNCAMMVHSFPLEDKYLVQWKQILPAAVESGRRDWKHKESCEYFQEPAGVSFEAGKSSICSCGQGIDMEGFPREAWMAQLELGKLATRIALPFLSGVSYVESMDSGMRLRGDIDPPRD